MPPLRPAKSAGKEGDPAHTGGERETRGRLESSSGPRLGELSVQGAAGLPVSPAPLKALVAVERLQGRRMTSP